MALAAPAHADGFNIGSFVLGNGGSSWVPQCKAPQVLIEVKDRTGKIHWVCVTKDANNQTAGEVRSASNVRR
ncbi:MAG: hypothetical protein GC190_01550 [Alphaproteobacteria bacterium]|nr:hypothetical protein [Alphaproteobacteria bacterium]